MYLLERRRKTLQACTRNSWSRLIRFLMTTSMMTTKWRRVMMRKKLNDTLIIGNIIILAAAFPTDSSSKH